MFTEGMNVIKVDCPYDPSFIKRANEMSGRYYNSSWHFDLSYKDEILTCLKSYFKYDHNDTESHRFVDLKVTMSSSKESIDGKGGKGFYIAGKMIGRKSKDEPKKVTKGRDVTFYKGGMFIKGGIFTSACISPGSEFTVKEVPLYAAKNLACYYGFNKLEIDKLEIIDFDTEISKMESKENYSSTEKMKPCAGKAIEALLGTMRDQALEKKARLELAHKKALESAEEIQALIDEAVAEINQIESQTK